MERYSVRKPFTVLVAVIAAIALGFVAMTSMATDLLPQLSLPYLLVITTYPGASPEKVEMEVSRPMERALGTVSHVKEVVSVSAENYSMVQMEFEDGTDMDSAMVKVSSAVMDTSATLPDACGTPNIMEISMDMVATMYVAVSREGYDVYELSDYVREELQPVVERQEGVASVTSIGLVDRTVQVELNRRKIRDLNDRILANVNYKLDDAARELEDAKAQVEAGQKELEKQEASFGKTLSSAIFGQIGGGAGAAAGNMKSEIDTLRKQLQNLRKTLAGISSPGGGGSGSTIDIQPYIDAQVEAQGRAEAARQDRDTKKAAWEQAQQALEEAKQALDEGEEPPEELVQAEAQARQAYEEAEQAVQQAEEELQKATEALEKARQQKQQQASSGSGAVIDTSGLVESLDQLIRSLENISSMADAAESVSALMRVVTELSAVIPQINALLSQIPRIDVPAAVTNGIDNVDATLDRLERLMDDVPGILDAMQSALAGLTQGQLDAAVGFSTAASQLTQAQQQLEAAQEQFENAREQALKQANVDSLVNINTLSQLIYAQNFAMPAGYIDDKYDNSWLLKVGDEYADSEGIADALLCRIDEIGSVRLEDVADITVIDTAGNSYAKLTGEQAVVLAIYKSPTSGTNEVSAGVNEALKDLEEQHEGLRTVNLMDQGSYITLIISDLLRAMITGALLAIVILAIFLRDIRPTLVVGISIPLSVLFTMVLMYFSGLTLNIMTLSGLSLGIGMLVDNSIVVMENIFRLRGRGIAAARAAVQGTRQVSGAIISSTLTTVCVFLPMAFSEGTVRELLVPMGLSIGYCLLASLVTAMTVVPASASTILQKVRPKEQGFFDRVLDRYGKSLRWCLKHKPVVLAGAVALLVLSIWRLVTMGIVILPEMTGDSIQVSIYTREEDTREESYAKVDAVMERIMALDNVQEVGIMDASTTGALFGAGGNSDSYGGYVCYVTPENGQYSRDLEILCDRIEEATEDIDCNVYASTGGMSDMSAMMASGLTINVYGQQLEQLQEVAARVAETIGTVKGFTDISDGSENSEQTLHLVIDKDKAMAYGLTVAQIYGEIAQRLNTSVNSTTITVGGVTLDVVILDETDPLLRENILEMEFTSNSLGSMQSGAGSQGAAAALMGGSAGSASEEEEETTHQLSEFAYLREETAPSSIRHGNLTRYIPVTASTEEGYNTTLLSRQLQTKLDHLDLPRGYHIEVEGESSEVNKMVSQMTKLTALALLFIYLVMVAQFQSLLSPFIVLFTIPLAFTGGMIGLIISGQQLSMLALMGFLILMGTVVNNGIVFVDYANQLRQGGLQREDALVATGQTRMRPILMTAMTTILAMSQLIFGSGMGSQMGSGMAIVIAGGLTYATLMTLYVIPIMYDILFKRQPLNVEIGDDIDDVPDDAAEFLARLKAGEETEAEG